MIVTEEEAKLRLESMNNLANKMGYASNVQLKDLASNVQLKDLHHGRTGPKLPPMVQTLAVALGKVSTQQSAAETFGIRQQSVSHLTREGTKVDRDVVQQKVQSVHLSAIEAMVESIETLRPKLQHVKKATELSKIASDMANVVNRTTPQQANQANLVVVAYAPRQHEEKEYEEVITVSSGA